MSELGECQSCRAPVVWTVSPSGASSPIDRDPVAEGTVLVLKPSTFGAYLSVVLSKGALERARANGLQLRTSHFASCPNAKEHRRGRS